MNDASQQTVLDGLPTWSITEVQYHADHGHYCQAELLLARGDESVVVSTRVDVEVEYASHASSLDMTVERIAYADDERGLRDWIERNYSDVERASYLGFL